MQIRPKSFASNLIGVNTVQDAHISTHAAFAGEQTMHCSNALKVAAEKGAQVKEGNSQITIKPNNQEPPRQTIPQVIVKSEVQQVSSLPTPVSWKKLQLLLVGYDEEKAKALVDGFQKGFSIHFRGDLIPADHKTLISAMQNPDIVEDKLRKELDKGRIAGPFDSEPFPDFKTSLIGLVPKKTKGQFRLIHHLSYPKKSLTSVNAGIPQEFKSVSYASVQDAILFLRQFGRGCYMAKTDIESAFRIIPIEKASYPAVGFVWKGCFYYDKCMAMGAASSCRTFEQFSTALEWIAYNKGRCRAVVHILDDFLFLAPTREETALSLRNFQELCDIIGVPLSEEKTFPPSTCMEFMGITLDADRMEARLPDDKVIKMRQLLLEFKNRKSCTLKELLSLLGLLNFACSVIQQGRAFLRRLTNLTIGITDLHHFMKINNEAWLDIAVWLEFLLHFNGKAFFLFDKQISSDALQLYTDASRHRR